MCFPASSSKSPDKLFASLNAFGLPNTQDAHQFVNELFSRVPRKQNHSSTSDNARKQAEKDTKALLSKKFGFLLDEEGDRDVTPLKADKRKGKEREKERPVKQIRKREYDTKEWE